VGGGEDTEEISQRVGDKNLFGVLKYQVKEESTVQYSVVLLLYSVFYSNEAASWHITTCQVATWRQLAAARLRQPGNDISMATAVTGLLWAVRVTVTGRG
jgi:hypothetical protein